MFILTLSDIVAVIFFIACVIAAVYTLISTALYKPDRPKLNKAESPKPISTTPKPLPKLPLRAWLIIIAQVAILLAVLWFIAHTLKI
jgi:hypothetical protein